MDNLQKRACYSIPMAEFTTFNENPFSKFRERLDAELNRADSAEKVEGVKFRSNRAELFNELYSLYEKSYKKNMWDEYRQWLRKNRFKHTTYTLEQFKKSSAYRKQIPVGSFCSFWFGFLTTSDLCYLISVAKDKDKRGENLNKWLFWSIKKQ